MVDSKLSAAGPNLRSGCGASCGSIAYRGKPDKLAPLVNRCALALSSALCYQAPSGCSDAAVRIADGQHPGAPPEKPFPRSCVYLSVTVLCLDAEKQRARVADVALIGFSLQNGQMSL